MMQPASDPALDAASDAVFEAPVNLSPSRVAAFTACPLAFRFSSVERLPEPPSLPATRGSMVHRALELFFLNAAPQRTASALDTAVEQMLIEYRDHGDLIGLDLDQAGLTRLHRECHTLSHNYLDMEDPTSVRDIGLELRLETDLEGLGLRGIIDRLDLGPDGGLVITDYKTGRAPPPSHERASLAGVSFYALLCQEVLGQRPVSIRLMYLKTKQIITTQPTDQSLRFLVTRTRAVFTAIERACVSGDFRPRPSALCRTCAFQRWCPEFDGDPERAAAEAPLAVGLNGGQIDTAPAP